MFLWTTKILYFLFPQIPPASDKTEIISCLRFIQFYSERHIFWVWASATAPHLFRHSRPKWCMAFRVTAWPCAPPRLRRFLVLARRCVMARWCVERRKLQKVNKRDEKRPEKVDNCGHPLFLPSLVTLFLKPNMYSDAARICTTFSSCHLPLRPHL